MKVYRIPAQWQHMVSEWTRKGASGGTGSSAQSFIHTERERVRERERDHTKNP